MNRGPQLIALTLVLMIVGAAVLKGCGDTHGSDPTASVENGAPRGLLALELLLEDRHVPWTLRSRFEDALPSGPIAILVPPPERSAWTDADVDELVQQVRGGARALVFCDEDELRAARLKPLLEKVGVQCESADVPIGDESVTRASGVLPGFQRNLSVRGTGRVKPHDKTPVYPAWLSGTDVVVMKRSIGSGVVTVVGSTTVVANDGLARADNAAFVLEQLGAGADPAAGARRVVIDERHHGSRSAAAFAAAALSGPGPLTALVALLLLVPLSLLSLAPRVGDPPGSDEDLRGAPAAEAQVRALASLLARVRRPHKRR